ncbi:type VI secretion protein VasK [Pseudomonas sp. S35]|uniref:type VI secretion system membrane subunit TssM n=1 Tax=Pseudomonas sp. S35 TaxID=1573719 RepID=UPI00132EB0ED|nr:type VI secretion system membrane subunit TssM [Pseudomonas sp. S35]QHF44651.1 type VI secretion protein VasK [Pseudomonas sp. S35]
MNAFFKGAGRVLRNSWAWSLLGVLSSALLVWFFGPLLAVDDHRFWQDATARLLTISGLFLVWGLAMVMVGARRTANLDRPELQERYQRQELFDDERRQVRGRFKDALHALKTTRRYGERGQRWRNNLPWYLLIGAQHSGKTRLLGASGAHLALAGGKAMPQGMSPCFDWYLADEAVVVKSAGCYLAQADRSVEGVGWSTFLGLLKTRHRAHPLNGVVVTLAVQTLLGSNELDVELQARHVHNRLQDIQHRLHVDVPVYLVLTQADRLPGFAEFFDALQGDSAEGVLGQPLAVGTTGTEIVQVREAFETLLQRLAAELIARLHLERDLERRGQMLDFPQQAAHIGERLCLFVESAFPTQRFQHSGGLRGFYLTCAEAADRRSYFVQGLFNKVIFAEADLAVLQPPERRRIRRRQGLLVFAVVLVIGGAGALWTHSYTANQQRLTHLAQLIEPQPLASPGVDDTLALLPLLDSHLAAAQLFPPQADTPWVERAGLYQGEVSRPLLTRAYENALHQQLLPLVVTLLEDTVRASLGDRDVLIEALQAYLMLSVRERRDTAWLAQHVAAHWAARYTGDASVQDRLNKHLARLLALPFVAPSDVELVAQAREELRGESLAGVVYRVLREQARDLEPYRLADGHGFATLEQSIPGFYTKRYVQYFETQGLRQINSIAQDNWVLGDSSNLSAMDLRQLMLELEQRYFTEYAEAWSHAIGQVRVQENDSLRQHAQGLAHLASAQSPLVKLLQQVRENTRLLATNNHLEAVSQRGGELGATAPNTLIGQFQGQAAPGSARRALQHRFEPLHHLLDAEQNPGAELKQALRLLDEWHLQLAALNREGTPEQAAFKMVKQRMDGQQSLLGNVRDAAARLPLPVKNWFAGLADDGWRLLLDDAYRHVNQRYQSEVYGVYAKAIRQRYPFDAHASSDVALGDFQAFFKPQGGMERFYENYLRSFVSVEGGRYRLRGLDGRSLALSRALLDQLDKVQLIRQGFFTEDQGEWAVRFTLAPYSLDQAVNRAILRIGDKQLEYRHGPIVPMAVQWPSDAGDGRTSLVLERGSERALGIEKNSGPWSLFRFLDLLQSEPASGRDTHLLKADLGGLRANFLLTSQRSPGPFQTATWRTFRLPEQL